MALLFIRLDDGRTAQDSLAHRPNRRAPVTAARSRHRAGGVRASDCANGATGRRPAGRPEWPAPSGRTGRQDTTTAVRRHSRQLSVVPGRLKPCTAAPERAGSHGDSATIPALSPEAALEHVSAAHPSNHTTSLLKRVSRVRILPGAQTGSCRSRDILRDCPPGSSWGQYLFRTRQFGFSAGAIGAFSFAEAAARPASRTSSSRSGHRYPYTSRAIAADLCPSIGCTTFTSAPAAMTREAAVCRSLSAPDQMCGAWRP